MTKRQLTYYVPLQIMCQTLAVQEFVTRAAVKLNGEVLVNYVSQVTPDEAFSTMVISMIVSIEHADYIHRSMKVAIIRALALYSPETTDIHVTDEPIMVRDFNVKETF